MAAKKKSSRRLYIIGAGFAGRTLAEEFKTKAIFGEVVAFLEDDKEKIGRNIDGIPVLGPIRNVASLLRMKSADEAVIAMPGVSGEYLGDLYNILKKAGFDRIRILPSVSQIIDGSAHLIQTRSIDPQDLLGRTPVAINLKESLAYLKGKRVLVTGAGGSIGSELCRQLLSGAVERLYLFGHGENSIYQIDRELRILRDEGVGEKTAIVPVIGDIKDADYLDYILGNLKADAIFHTAAYKHVPLMEENPVAVIENNCFGTENLVNAAIKHHVKRFVLITTDKAVEPVSIYGASKFLAEKIVLNAANAAGNGGWGMGNGEEGRGKREEGTGNGEQGTGEEEEEEEEEEGRGGSLPLAPAPLCGSYATPSAGADPRNAPLPESPASYQRPDETACGGPRNAPRHLLETASGDSQGETSAPSLQNPHPPSPMPHPPSSPIPHPPSSGYFMAVRFGNVLGSRGSILPLFQKQIEKGGPITVTHGEMRRWFMTIPEACSLVLKAGGVGENGALYLLDMGEPIRIRDMAEQMIRFYGYEPEIDIKIETIGLRRGEKLFETLLSADEIPVPTREHKILKIEKNRQPALPFDSSSLDVPALLERLRPVCHFDPAHAESYRNTTLLRSILAEAIPTMTE